MSSDEDAGLATVVAVAHQLANGEQLEALLVASSLPMVCSPRATTVVLRFTLV